MDELVIMKSEQALTTSLKVAETFEKRHDHVIRDIDNIKKDVPNFGEMFQEATVKDSYGRDQRVYYMNRDGFTLLAMGYTGKKALEFKLKYIEAFNKMEKIIREQQALPQSPEEQLQLTMVVTNRLTKRMDAVEKRQDYFEKTSELNSTQRYQLWQARKARVIEAVGGGSK